MVNKVIWAKAMWRFPHGTIASVWCRVCVLMIFRTRKHVNNGFVVHYAYAETCQQHINGSLRSWEQVNSSGLSLAVSSVFPTILWYNAPFSVVGGLSLTSRVSLTSNTYIIFLRHAVSPLYIEPLDLSSDCVNRTKALCRNSRIRHLPHRQIRFWLWLPRHSCYILHNTVRRRMVYSRFDITLHNSGH